MKAFAKFALEQLMHRVGCEVVPKWRMEKLAQTLWLKRLFEVAAIDCVFDVGANRGQYAEYLRNEVEFRGWIVSYEPIPECNQFLNKLARDDPKWIVCGCALGRKAGVQPFNVMSESQFSSFRSPAVDALAPADILAMNKVDRVVDVETKTLEDEVNILRLRLGFTRPYLKLDTQGYDSEITMGAGSIIRNFLALQTELAIISLYKDGLSCLSG
jgi:FkbM family methyltransferase